jgi:CRISPR-associated protein Cmr4
MTARLTFVHALSPLHAGIGQGIGVIDLPIAREKATGLPFLPGSSLKGTLRASCEPDSRKALFGPEVSEIEPESNYASSVQFSDQRLLLLPIRSLAGTFAWVTSPFVLHRLLRDMEDVQQKKLAYAIPALADTNECFITDHEIKSKIAINNSSLQHVYLEDLDLTAKTNPSLKNWAEWIGQQVFPSDKTWQDMLVERFCLVHDDVFNFLIDTATEITARIKLNEGSKTVQDGGLWYEEALPTETILSGIVLATPVSKSGMDSEAVFRELSKLMDKTLQLGGKATVGQGMCRVLLGKESV